MLDWLKKKIFNIQMHWIANTPLNLHTPPPPKTQTNSPQKSHWKSIVSMRKCVQIIAQLLKDKSDWPEKTWHFMCLALL